MYSKEPNMGRPVADAGPVRVFPRYSLSRWNSAIVYNIQIFHVTHSTFVKISPLTQMHCINSLKKRKQQKSLEKQGLFSASTLY
jgi:hypothetical protein